MRQICQPILLIFGMMLCSCTTKQSFQFTHTSGHVKQFESIYRPVNHRGGSTRFYASNARDATVEAAKAEAAKLQQQIANIELTQGSIDYSLSGYYTFRILGKVEIGKEPSEGLMITDKSSLMQDAAEREARNLKTGLILSPTIAGIQYLTGGYPDPNPRYKYRSPSP